MREDEIASEKLMLLFIWSKQNKCCYYSVWWRKERTHASKQKPYAHDEMRVLAVLKMRIETTMKEPYIASEQWW